MALILQIWWFESLDTVLLSFIFQRLLTVGVIAVGAWIALRVLTSLVGGTLERAGMPETVRDLATLLVRVLGWFFAGIAILGALGLGELALAAGGILALLSLAIGMASKDMITDLVSGSFLAVDPDFEIGYQVEAGGVDGKVKGLDLRKTRIEDREGNLHVVPNSDVDSKTWIVKERD